MSTVLLLALGLLGVLGLLALALVGTAVVLLRNENVQAALAASEDSEPVPGSESKPGGPFLA